MAGQLGEPDPVLRLPAGTAEGDVHDECRRSHQRTAAEGHKEAGRLSNSRIRTKGSLPRDHESKRTMEPAREELEGCTLPPLPSLSGPSTAVMKRPFTQKN